MKGNVLVLHTRQGEELDALGSVLMSDDRLFVLGASSIREDEVQAFREKHSKARAMGYWFKRSAGIARAIKAITEELEKPAGRKRAACAICEAAS